MSETTSPAGKGLSRRHFLRIGGIGLGALTVGMYSCTPAIRRGMATYIAEMEIGSGIKDFDPLIWFEIQEDNTVLFRCPKVEMGQGTFTGFALLAAEELNVRLDQVRMVPATSQKGPYDAVSTGGSSSTSSLYQPIREVAATLREMLKQAASALWGVPVAEISAREGALAAQGKTITYAELVAQTTEWVIPNQAPALKPKTDFSWVGKEVPRVDLKPKVMGEPIYALDAELPGMVYACTLESPYFNGTLKSVDTTATEQYPGVEQVIREGDWVVVVAKTRYAAEMGVRKLKAEWDVPRLWQQSEIDEMITVGNGKGVNIQKKGQVRRIFAAQPEQIITAEYRSPIGVHAQMEPNGGIADVKAGKAKVICGTQSVAKVVKALEDVLGFSDDRIEVVNTYLGGAFGRRLYRHKVVDAARISKRIGKPVHAFRTREEEFLNAYYRPNNHHVMYATLKDGRIEAIEHLQASDDMWVSNNMPAMRSIMGSDFPSANHGARIFYPVANRSTSVYDIELPFPTGVWRGVGAWLNYFATESFMDELALAAQADPVAFRLAHLQGQEEDVVRLRKVVERVQERSGWDQPLPEGVGRGFAIAEDRRTVVAMAVEVRIVKGMVRVSKVTCGMDAGTIVNPEGARTQVEGCIMMGISAALYEELTIKDSQFTASNFHEYPIATLMDTPEMEILMIEGREQPSGVGEPPIAPVAPAIANAIFDLTGKRLRNIPLRV